MPARSPKLVCNFVLSALAIAACGCMSYRHGLVTLLAKDYRASFKALPELSPVFEGADTTRTQVHVRLVPVADGLVQPTDVQFVPGEPNVMWVSEKGGALKSFDMKSGRSATLLRLDVLTVSEQGLVGMAFHPEFERNGRIFLNYTVGSERGDVTHVAEWRTPPKTPARLELERVVLEVGQPYQNHNGGQLVFGPDGYLYIGLGDGGWAGDPHGHGQDPTTMLGSMLRLDVDGSSDTRPYAIPPGNPFLGKEGYLPELWAIGLRNPWRYSFDHNGRLIAGDAGQDRWEEINFVPAGANLGWRAREGRHCFKRRKGCGTEGFLDSIWEYGRAEGNCVVGGYVAHGGHVPALEGKYVFGDFLSGRMWAMELPASERDTVRSVDALGRWPILISTFGRDASGRLYVADYYGGVVYRIDAQDGVS